ncbi:MAG: MFS transporter [Haloferacaceae archaeon]
MTGADGGERSATIPWHSRTLYFVLASSLIGVMGVSLISPVLPDLRPVFGVSDAQIGLVITAYTLPGIVVTPFIGLVADRIGRRNTLVPLLVLFGVAGAAIGFVDSFRSVIALRFLQGIGASALVTLAITVVGDVYVGPRRTAVIGLNASTIGTGAALYPLVGGALATIRWSAPFLFFGVGILVGAIAAVLMEEPGGIENTSVRTYLARLRAVLFLPEALAIYAAIFVAFTVFYGAVLTALPLLLSDEFGLNAGQIGPVLATTAVASATVSSQYGRISQWRSPAQLVALGFLAYGLSLLGIWIAPSPVAVGGALLLFGVGFGVVMPSIDTTVITMVSTDLRAGMMGMRTSLLRLGQTVGPIAFTFLADTLFPDTAVGYRILILGSGIAVTLGGGLAYAVLRR